jgi:hypothetical protein
MSSNKFPVLINDSSRALVCGSSAQSKGAAIFSLGMIGSPCDGAVEVGEAEFQMDVLP